MNPYACLKKEPTLIFPVQNLNLKPVLHLWTQDVMIEKFVANVLFFWLLTILKVDAKSIAAGGARYLPVSIKVSICHSLYEFSSFL